MYSIKLNNLSKSYGNHQVLKNINYDFMKDKITCILGHNGAGKSTMVKCILDLIDYTGDITYDFDKKDLYQMISPQLQFNEYEQYAKVKDLCRLYLELRQSDEDLDELLKKFDLLKYKDSYVNKLSGGEKQRLNIALALIGTPKVLILDEMTTSLDVMARKNIWNIIKDIKKAGDITIILTSHFMDEVEYLADQILIIDQGEKYLSGSLEDIKRQVFPNHTKYRYINDAGEVDSLIVDNRQREETLAQYSANQLKEDYINLEDVFLAVLNYRLTDEGERDNA